MRRARRTILPQEIPVIRGGRLSRVTVSMLSGVAGNGTGYSARAYSLLRLIASRSIPGGAG